MKRGQVTLFIVLGIVLAVIALVLAFYSEQVSEQLSKAGIIKKEALDVEADKIKQSLDTCLKDITEDAVFYIAERGGLMSAEDVTYYAKGKQLTAPTLNQLEESISEYVNHLMPLCLVGEQTGAAVDMAGKPEATAKILKGKVTVDVDYPVRVAYEESSTTINRFSAEAETRLLTAYNIATSIADTHKDKAGTCISCIFQQSADNNMKIDISNPDEDADLFLTITDQEQEGKQLTFIFAVELGGIE